MPQLAIHCLILIFILAPNSSDASPVCKQWAAKVVSIQGQAEVQRAGGSDWQAINESNIFCWGDKIRTIKLSRVTLLLRNKSSVTLDQSTTLSFLSPEEKKVSWFVNLLNGSTFFRSRQPQQLNIKTPFINAVHKGTEFLVTVDKQQTQISVFDGEVMATNQWGKIQIKKGYQGIAQKNKFPQLQVLTIHLEDAVQWALYYPPVIDYPKLKSTTATDLQPAIRAYRQGHSYQALQLLKQKPINQKNITYLAFKASLLLTLGRVDEAQKNITQILSLSAENSTAIALKSVIAVAKNHRDIALTLAKKAVSLDPQSAVAHIALSYAYQAHFKMLPAKQATTEAIKRSPENALAWDRLSELQLSLSEYDQALLSAQKALALNPDLTRTQAILGFIALVQINLDAAQHFFTRAINLDSSYPLAHLGLALSEIRRGHLDTGKQILETAITLDPDNAIIRSYLGKAFYQLDNNQFAQTELTLAEQMDPKDPTPWFYDAILKQTSNRPVAALQDMQKALELNGNRGIYRSKLLLDQDAASRTSNLARIYQDLGFGRVALKQAWSALGYDSTNYSAHRFLSDAYIGKPRFRIARASELLQAQLLQPINITPVQPQLTAENIGILNSTGPSRLSAGEYDPLFTANGAHLLLNGAYGSNNTKTDNAIISGIYNKLSMSLGQFHFQTDGFRQNDDYKQDIYNAFVQYIVSPDFNFQFEFKTDDVRNGDVPFRLNGVHQLNLRQTLEHDIARVGAHYRITPEQDVIVSAFYTSRNDQFRNKNANVNTNLDSISKGFQTEIQYLLHPATFNMIVGAGYLGLDNDNQKNIKITSKFFNIPPIIKQTHNKTEYFNAYLYTKHALFTDLTGILGLSFDSYRTGLAKRKRINPKIGLIWNAADNLTLRTAAFRSFKRPLAVNQTIEPTQIAGFNQFFDGTNGTSGWQYSVAADYRLFPTVFMGGALNWRYNNEPVISQKGSIIRLINRDRNEISHIAYLYWTPVDWLSFKTEYRFDKFARDFIVGNGNTTDPQSVATNKIPLAVNFFHPNGIFAKLRATYIKQKVALVSRSGSPPLQHNHGHFWTFDTAVGYRLPKKLGLISFEVRNLFDNHFVYQSVFDASGPQLSPFVPERQVFAKLSFFY